MQRDDYWKKGIVGYRKRQGHLRAQEGWMELKHKRSSSRDARYAARKAAKKQRRRGYWPEFQP